MVLIVYIQHSELLGVHVRVWCEVYIISHSSAGLLPMITHLFNFFTVMIIAVKKIILSRCGDVEMAVALNQKTQSLNSAQGQENNSELS